jgi:hypothetical protein
MAEEIVVDADDESMVVDSSELVEDEPEIVYDDPEPDEPAVLIDTSHEEDEPEPEEPEEVDGLADLKKQLDTLTARNSQLEAAVGDAAISEMAGQQREVEVAANVARGVLKDARDEFQRCLTANDHKGAADAQIKITEAHADVREFEAAANEIKDHIAKAKKTPRTPAAVVDPFEQSIASTSEATKAWCRANKADLTKSPARAQRALAAHHEAVEAGHAPDSPAYFGFIDKQMGYEVTKTPAPSPSRKVKPVGQARTAAPGGARSAPSNGGASEIRLSSAEVAIAKQMGIKPADYAKQKKEIIENGRDPRRSGPRYSNQTEANRR